MAAIDIEQEKPVKVTISDPETGAVLEEQVRAAQKMRDAGDAVSLIAQRLKVSRGTIRNYTVARKPRRR